MLQKLLKMEKKFNLNIYKILLIIDFFATTVELSNANYVKHHLITLEKHANNLNIPKRKSKLLIIFLENADIAYQCCH